MKPMWFLETLGKLGSTELKGGTSGSNSREVASALQARPAASQGLWVWVSQSLW